jgi:hypothetical protein
MEYVSYQLVSENTGSLNSGSYLNENEVSLFFEGTLPDVWYGLSPYDVTELGVFDLEQNLLAWKVLDGNVNFVSKTSSYLNGLDIPITYSYSELKQDLILYKNQKLLVNPPTQLMQSFGIESGSYVLSYNFVRNMAGSINSPLLINDISPSRKEVKLLPVGQSTRQYEAFCKKKILINDVSPLYIESTWECPYNNIYNEIRYRYISEINTLKFLFFLNTDGEVLTFLKNLYEDHIVFTRPTVDAEGVITIDPEKVFRIQGIRTSFNNYLLVNSDSIVDFLDIDAQFNAFVVTSIERKFYPIGKNPLPEYAQAKTFIYDFFIKYFYKSISEKLSAFYIEKYFSSLKNALNIGFGKLFPVINHGYLDERTNGSGSLTLLVKLQSELPTEISVQTNCWVSNISLTPYVIDTIIKKDSDTTLFTIGPPNFALPLSNATIQNVNKLYTKSDLSVNEQVDRELEIGRKINELSVDYTDFKNFIIFSSAGIRVNIFKNKVIQLSSLTSSLQELENKNNVFVSVSGSLYPFYTQEYNTIQGQMDSIIDSFDGYESYLYKSKNYIYASGSFVNSIYVEEIDTSASYYDKYNRDSLVNNTPQHIILDENNSDYLIFLSMIGHLFDNIYIYIASLPSEKSINQNSQETFSNLIINHMLETFGWDLSDTIETNTLVENYLTSEEISGLNELSSEDRIRIIRNRLLLTLPQIYKTKGTEAAVKLLISCYGIPSALLTIREFGGIDYSEQNASYTKYEKAFLYQWHSSSRYDHFRLPYPGKVKTIEYKFSIPNSDPYTYSQEQIQWGVVPDAVLANSISGSGKIHGGFVKERGGRNLGRVFFSFGYKGHESAKIYSNLIPIFDGNVYSVMVRRNDPDLFYQFAENTNYVPTKYDLYVQRNEGGRKIICSTSSYINYDIQNNIDFDGVGYFMIGGWFAEHNQTAYTGTFDKLLLWGDPITDSNFEDHVNNISSYAFNGSREGYKSLLFRMHTDYPFNLRQYPPGTVAPYVGESTEWWGGWENANGYYNTADSINRFTNEYGSVPLGPLNKMYSWGAWNGAQKITTGECGDVSQSVYPYQFKIIEYPATNTISKYGPNKFRNEKIKHTSQSIATRFDSEYRSTYDDSYPSPDSNLLGFFVDPMDFTNNDIVRYFGNYNFVNDIADPSLLFSSTYDYLRNLRYEYANAYNGTSGSNHILNEMLTIYKLYFTRGIFESIKNLVPARNNIAFGIVIEPTILERPKYQHKPVFSEMNSGSVAYFDITASKYFRDPNTKIVRISQFLEFADFKMDLTQEGSDFDVSTLPPTRIINLDVSYINDPSIIYPFNYLPSGRVVSDFLDAYQFGHVGSNNSLVTGQIPFDMIHQTHATGSEKYYLLKEWNTYTIYNKSGPWIRTSTPKENTHSTNSIQLYRYVSVSGDYFNSVIYSDATKDDTISNIPVEDNKFTHNPNTFKNTPNQSRNDIKVSSLFNGVRTLLDPATYRRTNPTSIFEIVSGYPRNHYTHKRSIFSPYKVRSLGDENGTLKSGSYIRSQQTAETTVGVDGLGDNTFPVETTEVGNVNLVQSDNVINQ